MAPKVFEPLTDYIPGPIEKKILVKGRFVTAIGKSKNLVWLIIGKYCSIHEFEADVVVDPSFYKVCTYPSGKLVIVDDLFRPFGKDLPEIGRRIHLTTRNGMYLVTRHANNMFAITCNTWKQNPEHADELWFYPHHFKCYAGGMNTTRLEPAEPSELDMNKIQELLPKEGFQRIDEPGEVTVTKPDADDLPF